MSAPTATETDPISSFKIVNEQTIAAPIEIVFQTMLEELGPELHLMPDKPFPMKLEAWPGGRWFRDLGNNTGNLWGHVQVIKPPILLEIIGPMPMSYPAINHLQYRLTAEGDSTVMKFTHQSMGLISRDHREGMPHGWAHSFQRIRDAAERRSSK